MAAAKTSFAPPSLPGWIWRHAVVAFISCGAALTLNAADGVRSSRKTAPNLDASKTAGKSIEALTASALKSVVVITHYGRDGKQDGIGSGFIVSEEGLIATSLHVIGEARPVSVQLAGGQRHDVTEVYASDRKLDLAIVRIDATNLPALRLGDSDLLKQGAAIVAIGNPLGLEYSVVQGVVSARREFDGVEMIQLAIPIEPGNSGGPLLDLQGRVHGILTLKSAMTANLGFAMPVNLLKPLLEKPNPVPMTRWLTLGALDSREWTPLPGARWTQKAGRILVEGMGNGFGGRSLCLARNRPPPQPYEVAVTVKLDDESGAAGLVFASDGGDVHYGFYPTAGQLRLTRFEGPTVFSWSILQTKPSALYRRGGWNDLRVRVETNRILCFVNGRLVIESEDHQLTGGQAGLAKFRDTKAQFKNFQIGTNLLSPVSSSPLPDDLASRIETLSGEPDAELMAALQPHAAASRALLLERAHHLETEGTQLRRLALTIHRQGVKAELVKALQASEEKIDLFHAALLLSKLDNPELDVEAYRRQLDEMAREAKAKLAGEPDDVTRLATLTRYLFTENGFHGSRGDFYNRANSYMNEVLDDREGLPITLSVLFIELAQRLGLAGVSGLPLPGHFMVRYSPNKGEDQIIDVFNGGKILSRSDAQDSVLAVTGEGFRDEDYKKATKREIIVRMLRNLLGAAQPDDSPAGRLKYLDLIVALLPDSAPDRLNRARLRLQTGDGPGAKEDFKWLLDAQSPGVDLESIAEIHRSL